MSPDGSPALVSLLTRRTQESEKIDIWLQNERMIAKKEIRVLVMGSDSAKVILSFYVRLDVILVLNHVSSFSVYD